jgi:hypothetical protein
LAGKKVEVKLGSATANQTTSKLGFQEGLDAAQKVIALYRADDETIREFLRRFAAGIEKKELAAMLVKTRPFTGENVPVAGAVPVTAKALLALLPRGLPEKKEPERDDVYFYSPTVRAGPSSNIEICEGPNGTTKITGRKKGGKAAAIRDINGQLRIIPDGLGSRNLRIVVKRKPGYTTVAGLRFLQSATINIGDDGTVEVTRVGIRARDLNDVRYVSKRVKHNGRKMILMVEVRKARPIPKGGTEKTDEEKNEARADTKLMFAQSLLKAGKKAKAREYCEEIIAKYPKTRAAIEARKMLEKLK